MRNRLRDLLLLAAIYAGTLQAIVVAAEVTPAARQCAIAPDSAGRFVERTLSDQTGTHRYIVYFPPRYSSDRRWPVILFLHGAGERGLDAISPTYAGLGPVLRHSPELYPCVVVFPQCETWDAPIFTSWSLESDEGQRALAILQEVERTESIDASHRSLTGWSMGGFGATAFAAHRPTDWQSILALSGGHVGPDTESLKQAPLWLIHGTHDSIVKVQESQQLATALGMPTSHSRYDEVTTAGHEVWEQVYSDPRVAKWLLEGGGLPEIDWSIPPDPDLMPTAADGTPFVPAAIVSRAIELRIGNDVLRMLSAGIPEAVPPKQLQGTLSDIQQSFSLDGVTYELVLSDLTYAAKLASAELTAHATSQVLADLGVMNLELQIGQAILKTRGFEAKTGAFRIVIGHRRPVPLHIRVKPRVHEQQLCLTLQETRFLIPDDNWYVEMPREIQLTGNKYTRHEIESGIVGGLYSRKAEVEEQIRKVIPPLLEQVEERLNRESSGQLTHWLWPFPVYQPRLRWTSESITIDSRGITVGLGAIIGASNTATRRPQIRSRSGTASLSAARRNSTNLHIVVDPLLIDSVSEDFAESGVARINVLDLSEARFHELAQTERMRTVFPSLSREAEVRSVLALTSPFQLRSEASVAGRGGVSHLIIPAAQLEVFSRDGVGSPWNRAGQFSIALDQAIEITLEPTPTGPPVLSVEWTDSPDFQLTTADTVDPQALLKLERDLKAAWVGWSQSRNERPAPAEDFALGDSRVRLDRLTLEPRSMQVDLVCPMAHLTVTGTAPLTYRVRGWNTYWSRPRTLEPGQTHRYEVNDPVEWQVLGTRDETYTIRPGEIARWNAEAGVTYEPPRTLTAPSPAPPHLQSAVLPE